jgi:hypothetical protein
VSETSIAIFARVAAWVGSTALSISGDPVRRHADPNKEVTMKYVALIYGDPNGWEALSDEEQQRVTEQYMALSREPVVNGGSELQDSDTATTIRVRDGETLTTDGPFAETKEQLGGFYLVDCGSLDEAIEFAARIPAAQRGAVEVRPLVER